MTNNSNQCSHWQDKFNALEPAKVLELLETPLDNLLTTKKITNPKSSEVYVFHYVDESDSSIFKKLLI